MQVYNITFFYQPVLIHISWADLLFKNCNLEKVRENFAVH